MGHPGDYLNHLTVDDYAIEAFGAVEGGISAGVGSRFSRTDPETRRRMKAIGMLPSESSSRARLVPVAPGKTFVRWCRSELANDFVRAAGGIWWSTDNIGDYIVRETKSRLGDRGDTGVVAREVSAVRHDWSDMGAVLVARTRWPITILVGFGRPVVSKQPETGRPVVLGDGKDLQFMMLNSWQGRPRGHEFLEKLFLGRSTDLIDWWRREQPLASRRLATRATAPLSPSTSGGYPPGVVRTT